MRKLLVVLALAVIGVVIMRALAAEERTDRSRVAQAAQRARAASVDRIGSPLSGIAESVDDAIRAAATEVAGPGSGDPEADDGPSGA